MYYRITRTDDYLMHHGILGQKWGVRNGPPYPLNDGSYSKSLKNTFGNKVKFKYYEMPPSEIALAKKMNSKLKEVELPYKITKNHVNSIFENNLSDEAKSLALVSETDSNYRYDAINLGHGNYKVYNWDHLERKPRDVVDAVMLEMFGPGYEEVLDDE